MCPQCGRIYPKQLECCPGLIDFALKWYGGPPERLGPNSRSRIIEFIGQHRSSASIAFLTQSLQWKFDGEGGLPLDLLKAIAAEVGPWLSTIVNE